MSRTRSSSDTTRPSAAITVAELSHTYAPSRRRDATPRPALDSISFEIAPGETFGILGPNGGGKSTLFRILATLLRPNPARSGAAAVFGHDVVRDPASVRRQIGVVFQNPSLDVKLTAEENLVHQGRLYGLGGSDLRRRIQSWLDRMNLAARRHDLVETFSGGLRRRLELAKSLLHEPRVLLLDEPTTGLDPAARRDLWRHLSELRERLGITIVLTTHLMDEAEHCDRLAFLADGRLPAIDTPENLKSRIGGEVVTVTPRHDAALSPEELASRIATRLGPWPEGGTPRAVDGQVRCEVADGATLLERVRAEFGGQIRSVTLGQPSLEDVFLHLAGRPLWQDETAEQHAAA